MKTAQGPMEAPQNSIDNDLLSALAGTHADRDSNIADKTRRVVLSSMGVIKERKATLKSSRALALAAILGVLLVIGPFVWWITDELNEGEHLSDLFPQLILLLCILCPALIAAVVVAGWARRRR